MTPDFRDRYGSTALVTGASSGLGRTFAEVLAARGFNLVLPARRVDRLEVLAERLEDKNRISVMPLEVDLADMSSAGRILDATAGIDIGLVVNCASLGAGGAFDEDDPADQASMLMVNCHAATQIARGFVPRLRTRGGAGGQRGGILFASASQGLIGHPYAAVHSATSAYVNALGEALWGELAPDGVDVLTLCADATATGDGETDGVDPLPFAIAEQALAALGDGPSFTTHPDGRIAIDRLLAMPRRDALVEMARAMKM